MEDQALATLVAVAARDRQELVEPALASIRAALPEWPLLVHRDPATTEYGADWLLARGASEVAHLDVPDELQPRQRVAAMRCDAALRAAGGGFDRILYLDSDVLVSGGFLAEFERLWPEVAAHGCGALTLGNYAGYARRPFLVRELPALRASVRTHGLGACLAFPVTSKLVEVAERGVERGSWDTWYSKEVAGSRVLTSDESYVAHEGRHSGMCAARHPGLDFSNPATGPA